MKRKNLFIGLSSLSVACLASAFAFLSVAPAQADTAETQEPMQVENVAMANGAQVRLSSDSTQGAYAGMGGLRFVMYIDKDTYDTAVSTYGKENVEVGMYYVGKNVKVGDTIDETTNAEMQDIDTIPQSARHAVMQAHTDTKAGVTENPSYMFCVAQLEIPENAYNTQLIANGYIKTTVGETVTYTWATNPVTRSIAQVASIAITKGETHADLDKYINEVVTEDTFAFANTEIETDMYKQAELNVGATLPAHLKVVWNSDNEEVATVDETGAITKVGKGTANITAKIGNNVRTAKVTIGDPVVLNIDGEEDAAKINPTNVSYLSASDMSNMDGYNGNVLKITETGNWIYNLYSDYSVAELEEIAKIYNTVTFKFAIDNVVDNPNNNSAGYCALMAIDNSTASVASKYYGGTHSYTADSTVWEEWSLSIVDYISLIQTEAETGKLYLPLFKIYCTGLSVRPDIYLGNIEFYLTPYIVKVDENTRTNGDISRGTYIGKASFEGDYTGNAIRIPGGNANNNDCAKINYSLEQLNALADKYDSVSMWLAVDNLASGTVILNKAWGNGTKFITKATSANADGNFGVDECNTWYKFTVSVEDFISICTTTDETTGQTTVNDNFYLFIVYTSGTTPTADYNKDGKLDQADIGIYVGDIYFE